MKALGALVGFLLVGAAFLLLSSRFQSNVKSRPAPEPPSEYSGRSPSPAPRVQLPATPEREAREEITRQRLPFFKSLRANFHREISSFGVTRSIDTLDIVVTDSDPEAIQALVSRAVSPEAEQYGFRKIRTFIANPPRSVEPLKLIAESTYDGAGRWNTFLK